MQRDLSRAKQFTRRALVLGGVQVAALAGLAGRLYDLQVRQAERYALLAEENRVNLRLLVPPRGRILDRFGEGLAVNRLDYRLVVTPEQTDDMEALLARLGNLVAIDENDRRRVLRDAKRSQGSVPVLVRENLSWEDVARVEVNGPDLPGVMVEAGQSRAYPYGDKVAHVTGYVASVAESELTDDPLTRHPDFRIGKNGIEKQYDAILRGAAGSSQVEVNAFGRVIRELDREEGRPGDDVRLSLDMGLQAFAAERFGAEVGSAAVLDVRTGEVLALVTVPSYDPSQFTRGLTTTEWRTLVEDPRGPLSNKAVAGQYSPGSTFKMLVAMAAMENGVADQNHAVYCPGHMQLGNVRFHCWKKGGHGTLRMIEAIQQSCDVYFYDVARRLGIDRIAEMCHRFDLGVATGIDLPGEKPGLVPTRDWKQATVGESWQQGDTVVVGIGQGYLLVTPLQLAVYAARLASNGRAVVPRLTRVDGPVAPFRDLGLNPAHMAVVREGMNRVTNSERGTAYRARITEAGFEMAGKTGSVQVRRITKAEREAGRKQEDLPWEHRDHGLFVAYAPVSNPRYACAVVVEHGGSGSKAAAPVARDILYEAQRRHSARDDGPMADVPPYERLRVL